MNKKKIVLLVILLYAHVYILPQINMEHLVFVINDYYSDFRQESHIKYCNVIQFNLDSLFKYCISDIDHPYPVVPPDTFLFTHNCVVYYYSQFPPDIKKNYQTLDSLEVAYEYYFAHALNSNEAYTLYDPPEPAYYFFRTDTIGTKVEYDPHGTAMIRRLKEYYRKHSNQRKANQ